MKYNPVLMYKVLIKVWTLQDCSFMGNFLWQVAIKAISLGVKEEYLKNAIFMVKEGGGGEKNWVG